MENDIDISMYGAERRIRPNGDRITIMPSDKFDNILRVVEVAKKIINTRNYKRYLSPGDKAQNSLTGRFEDGLDELETNINSIK